MKSYRGVYKGGEKCKGRKKGEGEVKEGEWKLVALIIGLRNVIGEVSA